MRSGAVQWKEASKTCKNSSKVADGKYFFITCNGGREAVVNPLPYSMDHTRKLIEASLRGEETAQKQLYDLYARQMLGICYRYTKSIEDAEDVLQEGFIRVFRNLDKYKGEGELGAWIRKIMVNAALNFLKKHQAYRDELLIREEHMHPVSDADPNILLQAKELLQLVRQLPAGYQAIFNLYAIEGYTHVEIGKMMGISEGTSRSQYMRARNLLISWIEKVSGETKKVNYV
jgi:RNA polymerase sigma factor (sigma-70 family)